MQEKNKIFSQINLPFWKIYDIYLAGNEISKCVATLQHSSTMGKWGGVYGFYICINIWIGIFPYYKRNLINSYIHNLDK